MPMTASMKESECGFKISLAAQAPSYTIEELGTAMQEAGFTNVVIPPFLPDLTFLLSGRKP
jgi:hypothetical protein